MKISIFFTKAAEFTTVSDDGRNSRALLAQISHDWLGFEPKVSSFMQKTNGQNMKEIFGGYCLAPSYLSSWNIGSNISLNLHTTGSAPKKNFTTDVKKKKNLNDKEIVYKIISAILFGTFKCHLLWLEIFFSLSSLLSCFPHLSEDKIIYRQMHRS